MPPKAKSVNRLTALEDSTVENSKNKKRNWINVEVQAVPAFARGDVDDEPLSEDLQQAVIDSIKKPNTLFSEQGVLQLILQAVNAKTLDKTPSIIAACTNLYAKKVDACFDTVQKLNSDVAKAAFAPQKKRKLAESGSDNEEENDSRLENEEPTDFLNETRQSSNEDEFELGDAPTESVQCGQPQSFLNCQTMMEFDADMTFRHPCTTMENDWIDSDNVAMKFEKCINDRTLLVGNTLRKDEFVLKAINRAIAASAIAIKEQRLKRTKTKKGRKGKEDDEEATVSTVPNDKPVFVSSPFYYHASHIKRESRFACFDDVAYCDDSRSLIFLHNQWDEMYAPRPDLRDDDFGLDQLDDLDDIDHEPISLVLEYLQGAYENATSDNHVLELELIDMLGLDKHDFTRPRDMRSYVDVTYEQTSDANKDPDKCLVDHLSIPGEQERVDFDLERTRNEIKRLYSGRVHLPDGPSNPQEDEIRRGFNKVPYCAMYENEDEMPFTLDQRNYLTEESVNTEMAILRKTVFDSLTPVTAEQIGIPKSIHAALRCLKLGEELPDDVRTLCVAIPNFFIAKQLLQNFTSTYNYLERSHGLLRSVVPFRLARYAQQMLASRLYKINTLDYHQGNQTPVFGASMSTLKVSAPKKPRLDFSSSANNVMFMFARNLTPLDFEGDIETFNFPNPITEVVSNVINTGKDREVMEALFEQFKSPNLFWSVVFASGAFVGGKNRNKEIEGLESLPITSLKDLKVDSSPAITDDNFRHATDAESHEIVENDVHMEIDDNINNGVIVDEDGGLQVKLTDSQNQALTNLEKQMNDGFPLVGESLESAHILSGGNEVSQDLFATEEEDNSVNFFNEYMPRDGFDFVPFNPLPDADVEMNDLPPSPISKRYEEEDTLKNIIGDFQVPSIVKKKKMRKSKPEKIPEYLDNNEDKAHWEGGSRRKAKKIIKVSKQRRKAEERIYDDSILFEPRKATVNVTVARRGQMKKKTSHTPLTIKRVVREDITCFSEKLEATIAFRADNFIKLKATGKFDSGSMFVFFRYPHKHDFIDAKMCFYRSHYHHLPFSAPSRIDLDLHYFTKVHRLMRYYENIKANMAGEKIPYTIIGTPLDLNDAYVEDKDDNDEAVHENESGDKDLENAEFVEAIDFDDHGDPNVENFDIGLNNSGGFRTPPMSPPRISATAQVRDFDLGEFHVNAPPPALDQSNLDVTMGEEDISFEFDAGVHYVQAVKDGYENENRYYLKRSIRYILMQEKLDFYSLPDAVSDMSNSMLISTAMSVAASTPVARKGGYDNFVDDGEPLDVIQAFEDVAPVTVDDIESDDDIQPDENDETVQKPFKIRGYHTFRSLLYYLPSVCIGPTVEQLNVRRIFTTVFHMVNENDLYIIGNNNDPVSVCSDFRIINFEDAPENDDDN